MPKILSNFARITNQYRIFFERIKNNVYPYKHVRMTIEVGDDYLLSVTAESREECLKKAVDKLPHFVDAMEYLSKFDLEQIGKE